MSTQNNNLSEIHSDSQFNAENNTFGIVVSEWNSSITFSLLEGAKTALLEHKVKPENILIKYVPGTYELAYGAQFLLQEHHQLDSVICLGCVIQGETKHFDFICQAAAQGIMQVGLKYNKPAIFGVLTTNNEQQAIDRSGGKHGNKGVEAALTAIKML